MPEKDGDSRSNPLELVRVHPVQGFCCCMENPESDLGRSWKSCFLVKA